MRAKVPDNKHDEIHFAMTPPLAKAIEANLQKKGLIIETAVAKCANPITATVFTLKAEFD